MAEDPDESWSKLPVCVNKKLCLKMSIKQCW